MICTEKEQLNCNVEKRGCYYNKEGVKNGGSYNK